MVGGIVVAFVILVVIGWIPLLGAAIAGFVAGMIARGAGRGAMAGFVAGITGGVIAVFILGAIGTLLAGAVGLAFIGGMIGTGIGVIFLLLSLGNAVVCAVAGAIGGAIRS
jgi:hypothetical protein